MASQDSKSSGEVMLVNDQKQPEIKPELPPNIALAMEPPKVKRPLTEAQKENLKRLIERNQKLAAERKVEREKEPPKEPVLTKKKRPYKQDLERKIVADRLSSLEELMKGFTTNFRNTDINGNKVATVPTPIEKPKKEQKPRKPKRPPTPTTTDFEETDFTETETESELDDRTVKKYIRKAQQKMETVKQIEQTLQRPANRYANMSIF
jgi:hypothetical protein